MNPPPRILYVDDDPGLARLVSRFLEGRGYAVEHASSGEAGLARIAQGGIDLVALDHFMPASTGLDILPMIRNLPAAPPVIYVTGSEDSRVAVAALKAGAVDYVWKDIQGHFRELLGEAIETALQNELLLRAKEAAEREVREARDRAEQLLQEMNHRVANSLALVSALARLQMGALTDAAARMALEEMQARIAAIAGVHRSLYTSSDVASVELKAYLDSLVAELEAAMSAAGREHPIRLTADAEIRVPTDQAVSLGVIITELVTNAYKYAYPGDMEGDIEVVLSRHEEDLLLRVRDHGVGWSGEGKAQGTGVGARIVKAMAKGLQATTSFAADGDGACVTLRMPLR